MGVDRVQCTAEEKGAELEGRLGLVYNVVCVIVMNDMKLRVSSSVEYE